MKYVMYKEFRQSLRRVLRVDSKRRSASFQEVEDNLEMHVREFLASACHSNKISFLSLEDRIKVD
jgi:hypothetical protein